MLIAQEAHTNNTRNEILPFTYWRAARKQNQPLQQQSLVRFFLYLNFETSLNAKMKCSLTFRRALLTFGHTCNVCVSKATRKTDNDVMMIIL